MNFYGKLKSGESLVFHPPKELPAGLFSALKKQGTSRVAIFPTSGSAGAPKFVQLGLNALIASAGAVNEWLEIGSHDSFLLALPTYHIGGFMIPFRAELAGASWQSLSGKWEASEFVRSANECAASIASLVPAQLNDLVVEGLRAPPSMRALVLGGAFLEDSLYRAARELDWPVLTSFGMTECASQVATEKLSGDQGRMSVLPHWQAEVSEDAALILEGDALFDGYWQFCEGVWNFEARPDGPWVTRDRVNLEKSILTPIGRSDRIIKILGEQVDLENLENRFHKLLPDLSLKTRLALVPIPDPRAGSRLVLAVEGHEKFTPELFSQFNQEVRPFERISGVVELERLPRSPLGKIRRSSLVQCVLEAQSELD